MFVYKYIFAFCRKNVMHVVYLTLRGLDMELLPVTADYDEVSVRLRQFTATRLMEIIEKMRPAVEEALADSITDLEPGRLQAHVALLKLHASLLKELGALYRVQERPREDTEQMLPVSKVQELLDAAQARMEEAVAAAAAEAEARALAAAASARRLSLQAAQQQLQMSLAAVKQAAV